MQMIFESAHWVECLLHPRARAALPPGNNPARRGINKMAAAMSQLYVSPWRLRAQPECLAAEGRTSMRGFFHFFGSFFCTPCSPSGHAWRYSTCHSSKLGAAGAASGIGQNPGPRQAGLCQARARGRTPEAHWQDRELLRLHSGPWRLASPRELSASELSLSQK